MTLSVGARRCRVPCPPVPSVTSPPWTRGQKLSHGTQGPTLICPRSGSLSPLWIRNLPPLRVAQVHAPTQLTSHITGAVTLSECQVKLKLVFSQKVQMHCTKRKNAKSHVKKKMKGVEGDLRTNFLSRGPSRDAVLSGCIVSVDLCVGAAGLFSFMAHGFF